MKFVCCSGQSYNDAVLQASRQTVSKDIKLSVVSTHFDSESVIVISVMMCSLWHKMTTVAPPRVSPVNLPSACLSHSTTPTSALVSSMACQICTTHERLSIMCRRHSPPCERQNSFRLPSLRSQLKHIIVIAQSFEAQEIKYVLHIYFCLCFTKVPKQKN